MQGPLLVRVVLPVIAGPGSPSARLPWEGSDSSDTGEGASEESGGGADASLALRSPLLSCVWCVVRVSEAREDLFLEVGEGLLLVGGVAVQERGSQSSMRS